MTNTNSCHDKSVKFPSSKWQLCIDLPQRILEHLKLLFAWICGWTTIGWLAHSVIHKFRFIGQPVNGHISVYKEVTTPALRVGE